MKIVTTLGLVLALAGAVYIFYIATYQEHAETDFEVPVEESVIKDSADIQKATANWTTYTNTELGFSFRYPPFEQILSEEPYIGEDVYVELVNLGIVVRPSEEGVSLREWFSKNVDYDGLLLDNGIFIEKFSDGRNSLMATDTPIPPEYGEVMGPIYVFYYTESPDGDLRLSLSLSPQFLAEEMEKHRYYNNGYDSREDLARDIIETIRFFE